MPLLDPKPDPFRRGQSARLSASTLNQIRNIGLRQIRGGKNTDVAYYGDRVVVSGDDTTTSPSVAIYVRQFAVLQEYDNYLLCAVFAQPNNADGSAWVPQDYDAQLLKDSISLVWVAKPYLLQRAPWDGATATFNGQTGVITYTSLGKRSFAGTTQEITPSYVPGDIILAVLCPTGYKNPEDDSLIVWTDLNNGGRVWSGVSVKPFYQTQATVGQTVSVYPTYLDILWSGSADARSFGDRDVLFPLSNQSAFVVPYDGIYRGSVTLVLDFGSPSPTDAAVLARWTKGAGQVMAQRVSAPASIDVMISACNTRLFLLQKGDSLGVQITTDGSWTLASISINSTLCLEYLGAS